MLRNLLSLFILLVMLPIHAQVDSGNVTEERLREAYQLQNVQINNQNRSGVIIQVPLPPEVVAYPEQVYFNERWQSAQIVFLDERKMNGNVRYRVFDQKVEVEKDGGGQALNLGLVRRIQFEEQSFILLPSQDKEYLGLIPYEEIPTECLRLFRYHYTTWREPVKRNGYNQEGTKRTLLRRTKLYVLIDQQLKVIEKTKDIFDVLGIDAKSRDWERVRKEHKEVTDQAVAAIALCCNPNR